MQSQSARLFTAGFFAILFGAISVNAARAGDCSNEQSLKSIASSESTQLSFRNGSGDKRRIYWIDQDGTRKFYGVVDPGNIFQQQTFAGHAWVVTDEAEKCLYAFVATAAPETVDVSGQAAGAVAPPPPGREVAQTQAAPPVAYSSPPQTAATPSVTDEPVPQVSPIEQLQLKGLYRLVTRLDATRMLNAEASGVLDAIVVQPEWDSAEWSFEAVTGTPFVRIRNAWKKTYLADSNGTPQAIAAAPGADEAQWAVEPVDGTLFVQFRNRGTDRFLLSVNGAVTMVEDFGQDQENASHWRLAPVTATGAMASPLPARPVYDAALLNCREIGGIWTGSSCRRPDYMTGPLVCPRGFFWADDIGECLWDGPRCPPWQAGPGGVCGVNLACAGGRVAPGPRGYPACYCPPGTVAWGNYPRLSCVPSVARIIPLLIPGFGGGRQGFVSGGHGRPPLGQVFGNTKFGKGQFGNNTPPGITVPVKSHGGGGTQTGGGNGPIGGGNANPPIGGGTCPSGTTGTPPNCVKLTTVKSPTPTPTPTGTKPPTGGGQIGSAVSSTIDPKTGVQTNTSIDPKTGKTTTQQVCAAGYTGAPPNCVKLQTGNPTPTPGPTGTNSTGATCVGGMQSAGACICPQGTAPVGSGNNFTCVAGAKPSQNIPCKMGQSRDAAGNCVDTNSLITCTGGTVVQGVCGCPSGTKPVGSGRTFACEADKVIRQGQQTCASGQRPATDHCDCPSSTMSLIGGVCTTTTLAKPNPGGGGPLPACASGQSPARDNCNCPSSTMSLVGGVCTTTTLAKPNPGGGGTNAGGGQTTGTPACSAGEVVNKCNCVAPMTVRGGRCVNPNNSGNNNNPDPNCSTCDIKQVPTGQQKTQPGDTQKGQTGQQKQNDTDKQKQDQAKQQLLKQQQDQAEKQKQQDLLKQQQDQAAKQKQQELLKQQQDQAEKQKQQQLQQQKQQQEQQQKLQQQKQQQEQQQKQQQQQQQQRQQQQQQRQQQQQQQQKQQQQQPRCPPPKHPGPNGSCV